MNFGSAPVLSGSAMGLKLLHGYWPAMRTILNRESHISYREYGCLPILLTPTALGTIQREE